MRRILFLKLRCASLKVMTVITCGVFRGDFRDLRGRALLEYVEDVMFLVNGFVFLEGSCII